jgi:hypothetical protein
VLLGLSRSARSDDFLDGRECVSESAQSACLTPEFISVDNPEVSLGFGVIFETASRLPKIIGCGNIGAHLAALLGHGPTEAPGLPLLGERPNLIRPPQRRCSHTVVRLRQAGNRPQVHLPDAELDRGLLRAQQLRLAVLPRPTLHSLRHAFLDSMCRYRPKGLV